MTIHEIRAAVALAEAGVTYTRQGAMCPLCGKKMVTLRTDRGSAATVRRHRCQNRACLVAALDLIIKSAVE